MYIISQAICPYILYNILGMLYSACNTVNDVSSFEILKCLTNEAAFYVKIPSVYHYRRSLKIASVKT